MLCKGRTSPQSTRRESFRGRGQSVHCNARAETANVTEAKDSAASSDVDDAIWVPGAWPSAGCLHKAKPSALATARAHA